MEEKKITLLQKVGYIFRQMAVSKYRIKRIISLPYALFLKIKGENPFEYARFLKIKEGAYYLGICKCGSSTITNFITTFRKISSRKILPYKSINKTKEKADFIFTFIRNPYSRVLSAYLDKIKGQGPTYNGKFIRKLSIFNDQDVSFKKFVKEISITEDIEMDPHLISYDFLLSFYGLSLNFVGKLENFEKDWNKLSLKLNLPPSDKIVKKRKNSKGYKLEEYYDEDLAEIIYKRYKKDFDRWYPNSYKKMIKSIKLKK